MTPGQNNAAMIDFGGRFARLVESRLAGPLHQCPTARGTPVRGGFKTQHGVALAAQAFHTSQDYRIGPIHIQPQP